MAENRPMAGYDGPNVICGDEVSDVLGRCRDLGLQGDFNEPFACGHSGTARTVELLNGEGAVRVCRTCVEEYTL